MSPHALEAKGRGFGNRVKIGLFLTNQHRVGADLIQCQNEQLALFRQVRDSGWDSIFTGQHYLPEEVSMLQPVPFLARISAESHDMSLGIGILLLPLQNPVHVAETIASLDITTEGRLIFGIGLGYRKTEFEAFGIPQTEAPSRLVKNLDLIIRLWAGEPVSVDLPWCRLNEVTSTVLPVQRPHPPIWVAANADSAVIRAATIGNTWMINPHATATTITRQIDLFRQHRKGLGLAEPADFPVMREVLCCPSRSESFYEGREWLRTKYGTYRQWGQDRALPDDEVFHTDIETLESNRFVVGTPEECLEQLLPWRKLGINYFIFRTHWPGMPTTISSESIRLLSDEVIPVLRAS